MDRKISSTKPHLEDTDEILSDVRNVLKTGRLILGPYTKRFEKEFAEYIGVKHAVAVDSCTTALTICLRHLGAKGNEVIVPTNTFIASPNSVMFAGGIPKLVDMSPDSLCIDAGEIQKNITGKTKGVMAVHIAGLPCPQINEIRDMCSDKKLFLIEDCAHAPGATIDKKKVGSFSDAGCFSFYPTKVMTTQTGGMITTNDDSLAEYARMLRHHGARKGLTDISELGGDWVMSEISAVLGIHQLKNLDRHIRKRNTIAETYSKQISSMSGIKTFPVPGNTRHSYYKYPTLLSKSIDSARVTKNLLEKRGIETGGVYYPPCHLQPLYRDMFGFSEGMFPVADDILKRILCLPIHVGLSDDDVSYVIRCLKEELDDNSNHTSG